MHSTTYALDSTWRPLLADLGVCAPNVLRRAGLLHDLLTRPSVRLDAADFHRFWEGLTYQAVLRQTRLALAQHYLNNTALPAAEIAFLLGFEEPNSFFRAFRCWTGQTPNRMRTQP